MTHDALATSPSDPAAAGGKHPRGLYTLFFTEMWERLSFYGMRALLVLFMVDAVSRGGMGLSDKTATAIYGLYTAGVYLACLPGGWMADRLLGAQRAIWLGGMLITAGHFVLGVPLRETFFLGLVLVILGTGLLKPNVSALVGELYPEGGARRDAGFTIFYMGINLGAAIGPFVCSTLGEKINWHYGFTAAGIGMLLGLIQFHLTRGYLGKAGLHPPAAGTATRRDWFIVAGALTTIAIVAALMYGGWIRIDPVKVAKWTTWVILGVAALYFAWAFLLAGLSLAEKRRMAVIVMLFLASAMFWSGFEQAGSSLNLFAERHTLRELQRIAFEVPAGWFQSLNAVFVITLAPLMAMLWVALARRQISPSLTVKVAWGLILLAFGFLIIAVAAKQANTGGRVWPTWLVATYFVHTVGELCLSPVGLSAVTKLAPPRLVGQMMGVWFVGTSLGNLMAGLLAGNVGGDNFSVLSIRFFLAAAATGLVLLCLAKPIQRLAGGIQ